MFKLVIQDDEGKTTVVPLIRDEITIGRKEGNTIRLTERNVSRRHARILRNNGEVHIEDLGSYNGIRVNNSRIAERVSLRVSDQVQIGDYKLYLKAEGVEQVDDARTMPIERVPESISDTAQTDVINAVAPAPTMPMGIPNTPAPQLVGNPARTLVAIADTDPQGRPVASAAAVAALTSPVGYGKLVILSSNFAGKEFELSRPQMIIGRTDENDIVVNHRSISRNHAKLVREPDTGRYTISDLQSSNGVRVNGQDYGKVELRRGDVVDLGHVRLRFVEPGEDFVFARDAVITDVPDAGSKKGLLVAALLAALVLGAVVIYFVTRDSDKKPAENQNIAGSGATGMIDAGAGSQVALETPIDAPAQVADPQDDKGRVQIECDALIQQEQWTLVEECARNKLMPLDKAAAEQLIARSVREGKADVKWRELKDAVSEQSIIEAKKAFDAIPKTSSYYARAEQHYAKYRTKVLNDVVARLDRAKGGDCKAYERMARSEAEARGKDIVDEAKDKVPCRKADVVVRNGSASQNPGSGTPVKNPDCDPAEARRLGDAAIAGGDNKNALKYYEQALACKFDPNLAARAAMSACKAQNGARAKYYYQKHGIRTHQQTCQNNGVDTTSW